jgi:prophage regulatory protein
MWTDSSIRLLAMAQRNWTVIDEDVVADPLWSRSLFLAEHGSAVGLIQVGPIDVPKSLAISETSYSKVRTIMPKHHHNSPWPDDGFVRLSSILAPNGPLPISRSSWWAGVASGRYPKSVKLGPRITAWRVEDIRALIARGI